MAFAVRRLANIGGGIVVVDGAEVLAELPLPVAGLLSDAPLDEVVERSRALVAAARRARLHGRFAVPAAGLPRPVGDPEPEADRPRAGRRRPLRARPAGGLRDPRECARRHDGRRAGEHERGWLSIEGGLIADVGAGDAAGCRPRTSAARSSRRARQHPSPPLPDPDARAGAGRRPLHVAAHALPGLGADRRGDGVRRRSNRPRRARALGLLDRLRPPLRLPAGRERPRSRRRCAPRASSASGSSPRAGRWTSAVSDGGLPPDNAGRGDRRRTRRHRAARRPRRRRRRADRRRAVLAVLGRRRA